MRLKYHDTLCQFTFYHPTFQTGTVIMVQIVVGNDATRTVIVGHGITVESRFEISPGIFVEPTTPNLIPEKVAKYCENFYDYSTILLMDQIATFSMVIEEIKGGEDLAIKTWNALWQFHLLSLSCFAPCFSLYTVSYGEQENYAIANRNRIINPIAEIPVATPNQLEWGKEHNEAFYALIDCTRFSSAMRYYGNSHYLFDIDARIMLLWAGIECLLNVDTEVSRRVALYATIMYSGDIEAKRRYFVEVKNAYAIRSRVVHGGTPSGERLDEGYRIANQVLLRILSKCVELGRVPDSNELDAVAISQNI